MCPLCSHGELSSMHLLHWCPAVAGAWNIIKPPEAESNLLDAMVGDEQFLPVVARLLHQVAYLSGSLTSRVSLEADDAARRLERAVRLFATGAIDHEPSSVGADFGPGACAIWNLTSEQPCNGCPVRPEGLIRSAALWSSTAAAEVVTAARRLVPIFVAHVPAHTTVFSRRGESSEGIWPLPPREGYDDGGAWFLPHVLRTPAPLLWDGRSPDANSVRPTLPRSSPFEIVPSGRSFWSLAAQGR